MSTPVRTAFLTVVSFVLFLSPLYARAEEADKAAPKEVNVPPVVEKVTPKEVTVPPVIDKASSAQPILPEDTSPRFRVKELRVSGNSLVSTDELLKGLPEAYTVTKRKADGTTITEVYDFRVLQELIIESGREREVSKKTIQGLTEYLLSVYQQKGYAGIYVYVPAKTVEGETKLQDGILQLSIIEGKVEKITIKRYDFDRQPRETEVLRSSVLESWSPVKEGQVIQKKELDQFIQLLNVNPDRYVSAVVLRSDKPDNLNLQYDVYEANPWHWYVQVDNAGTEDRQWSPRIGLVNTNLTGIDDRLSLMYQFRPDSIRDNYALFGSYELPVLSPRLRLGAYAGYTGFDIAPGTAEGINFLGSGWFYGGTLRYNVFQLDGWLFDFIGSVSHEESEITPSLGIDTDVATNLFGVGTEIHRLSDMANTTFTFNMFNSFGGSSKSEFLKARWDSDPEFTIYSASLLHKQFIDQDKVHELSGSVRGIASNERLIPAKMTAFGGLYSVRGYKEEGIIADGGVIASLQYRFDLTRYNSPTPQPGQKKSKELWPPNISLLAFTDYGQAKINDSVPGEEGTENLWGAGVGTLIELGSNYSAAVYCAWPLLDAEGTDRGETRLNFSMIGRW